MTKEQLQEKITKKQNQIAKMEKNLAKYVVDDEFTAMCDRFFKSHDSTELNEYRKQHNLMWLPEYYSKRHDLEDAKATLNKYQLELSKIENYENAEKIEVIWNFLQNWKSQVYKWILLNANKYYELVKNEKQAYKQYLIDEYHTDNEKSLEWRVRLTAENYFQKQYYDGINSLTKKVTVINYKYDYDNNCRNYTGYEVNEKELNEILDKDVRTKYTILVNEITHITGEIIDATNLSIGLKGDINGVVIGKDGTASVNTFSAGGWNIQCFHYRTKVNAIKLVNYNK